MSVLNSRSSPKAPLVAAACTILLLILSLCILELQALPSTVQAKLSGTVIPPIHETTPELLEQAPQSAPAAQNSTVDRPLILYAYSESETARENFQFFLRHGLHGGADFIIILNGKTDVSIMIPKKKNVKVVKRPNDCYDLGAYAEVLSKDNLYKKYQRFIMLNASIRGPFMPYSSDSCWSDMYLRKLTDEVKLVGMTANCWPTFHIQSMIWATDITGLTTLLSPSTDLLASTPLIPIPTLEEEDKGFFNATSIHHCFHTWDTAVQAEISASVIMRQAGFKIDALMTAYHGIKDYEAGCDLSENGDVLWDGAYFGLNLHPFETGFVKTNRDVDMTVIDKQTQWMAGREYSSWDVCGM